MKFSKMHGTGNDYVIVNCFHQTIDDPPAVARAVSERHTGVGADGLIMVCPSQAAAVRMEMYNADGSRAQMCGNGIRCVAKFAYRHRLAQDADISIETDDGVKLATCLMAEDDVAAVRIDMGKPRFAPPDLPARVPGDELIDVPIDVIGRTLNMNCVSMGNPHAVIFVESLDQVSLEADGRAIECHSWFPERINVHFVRVESSHRVVMLTWERGSGRTLACGTGAAAVCAAGARTGRTRRTITAQVQGGELDLEWADNDHIFLTGPAVEVFTGTWPPTSRH